MLELIQEGNIGLMKSVKMFIKTPPGEDFPTFATNHIEGVIRRYIPIALTFPRDSET